MLEADETNIIRTPWHLWLIGVVAAWAVAVWGGVFGGLLLLLLRGYAVWVFLYARAMRESKVLV